MGQTVICDECNHGNFGKAEPSIEYQWDTIQRATLWYQMGSYKNNDVQRNTSLENRISHIDLLPVLWLFLLNPAILVIPGIVDSSLLFLTFFIYVENANFSY